MDKEKQSKYATLSEEEKERKRAQVRAYKARNREKMKEASRVYYADNRESCLAASRRWKQANPDAIAKWEQDNTKRRKTQRNARVETDFQRDARNKKRRERYASNPAYAIERRLRSSLTTYMRKSGVVKSSSIAVLLGCDYEQFLNHISSSFQEGMTWDNRHLWEIDHIRPCASFDLTNPEDQAICFHYTNFQPLWQPDNRRKGSKWI